MASTVRAWHAKNREEISELAREAAVTHRHHEDHPQETVLRQSDQAIVDKK